jgi:two-component system sensor histidine kinase AtoS
MEEMVCPHLGGSFLFSAYPLLDGQGEVFGSIYVARDITKRTEMEEQIRRSEKLAALGQLAVGLAHEMGNAIAIIGGATQFLIKNTERDHPSREFLEAIDRSVATADGIIRDLLSFARPRPPIFQLLDIRTILDKACLLVKGRCEAGGIRIQKRHVQAPLQVQGDAEQLQQIFVNLMLNAIQAMPGGGILSLAASVDAEGEWVRIEIADTGVGIPQEYLDRVFDPFFTTKEGGTGLGLSVTYRIVQVHGGRITVESREGKGARFTISLPASRPGGRPCRES